MPKTATMGEVLLRRLSGPAVKAAKEIVKRKSRHVSTSKAFWSGISSECPDIIYLKGEHYNFIGRPSAHKRVVDLFALYSTCGIKHE